MPTVSSITLQKKTWMTQTVRWILVENIKAMGNMFFSNKSETHLQLLLVLLPNLPGVASQNHRDWKPRKSGPRIRVGTITDESQCWLHVRPVWCMLTKWCVNQRSRKRSTTIHTTLVRNPGSRELQSFLQELLVTFQSKQYTFVWSTHWSRKSPLTLITIHIHIQKASLLKLHQPKHHPWIQRFVSFSDSSMDIHYVKQMSKVPRTSTPCKGARDGHDCKTSPPMWLCIISMAKDGKYFIKIASLGKWQHYSLQHRWELFQTILNITNWVENLGQIKWDVLETSESNVEHSKKLGVPKPHWLNRIT